MNRHPLARPTVYIETVPWLRFRLAAARWIAPRRRLRNALGTAGILAALIGGLGALPESAADSETATAPDGAACQDDRGPVAG